MSSLGIAHGRPAQADETGRECRKGDLFTGCTMGDIHVRNRVVMAPLSRARADAASRAPTAAMTTYYEQRASAGMIVTEATHVSPFSVSRPGSAAICTAEQEQLWRRVTGAVHARGGVIVQQLYHVGRKAALADMPGNRAPLAPSGIQAKGDVTTRSGKQPFGRPTAMRASQISGVATEFRTAAARSLGAGFDGVEVHAANGYLIEQFLRGESNIRSDAYGGSVERRARFLLDVVDAVASAVPASRVGVRLSPHYRESEQSEALPRAMIEYLATALNKRGIAYVHLVEPVGTERSQQLAPVIRRCFAGGLILCGSFSRASAVRCVAEGSADCVAFGRLYIANPDLIERFRIDATLNEPRDEFFRSGGAEGYIDYPTLEQGR